ncbi:hypothetical protein KJ640_03580 [bacterium]|nr:hypothetical protein [bacterium]
MMPILSSLGLSKDPNSIDKFTGCFEMGNLKRFLGFVGVLGVLVVMPLLAEAADIYVPGNYTTIQAAVNAASNGDRIYISAGNYNEAVYVNKRIALVGVGTPTITAGGLGNTNTVTFDGTATNNASISRFRITGATGRYYWTNGNGIYCNFSSGTITNNTITGNDYGIYCSSSSPSITNNIITENGTTSIAYYGIYNYSGTPIIDYNCVWGNGSGGSNNYDGCFAGPNDTGKELEAEKKRQDIERLSKEIGISNVIITKWGKRVLKAIKEKKVFIGMTKEQVLTSLRKPDDINRSVGMWGVHEQWIYGNTYLYFEDGILTSFQD